MDWFERLTGFREEGYEQTRAKLSLKGDRLRSLVNGASYRVGAFEVVSLATLRERAGTAKRAGKLRVALARGDVREMHREARCRGALFQVASQFNMLEMTGPDVTPEEGVTRYHYDLTQGPACAIAAGAGTIYRNYFVPVDGGIGQTAHRQVDGLAAIAADLSEALGKPVRELWEMRNGYALCSRSGLDAIAHFLDNAGPEAADALRVRLAIGVQSDVEVTEAEIEPRPLVSQAFCSALPVAYTGIAPAHWRPFATLVLEAAYEATMWAAVLNAGRDASNMVLLTQLGGGAFGNDESWILSAMHRALEAVSGCDLDVTIVSYAAPSPALRGLVESFTHRNQQPAARNPPPGPP